jgi:hypothetical protein
MKVSVRTRALVLAVASGALLAVPFATPASAAQSVACAKINSLPAKGGTVSITFAQCTPTILSAGGTSTAKAGTGKLSGSLVVTITWKGAKGTTVLSAKYGGAKTQGKCAKGTAHITLTGSVLSGTGAAGTAIKKGEPVTASACAITSGPKLGQSSLEPGTKFKL